MRKTQVVGLLLWRGGLLLAGGSALYLAVRYGLGFLRFFGIFVPLLAEVGLGIGITGFLLVVLSLVLERIQDARRERGEKV